MEDSIALKIKNARKLLSVSLVFLFIIIGCQYQENTKLKDFQKEIDKLKNDLSKLQKDKYSLEYRVNFLSEKYKKVYLDISEKGFDRIDSNLGTFLVIVDDVKPYANGYKLKLRIGNPYFASFNGIKITIEWGKELPILPPDADADKFKQWEKVYKEHEESIKIKEITIVEQLAPGTWTRVEITLYPATKEELGYLNLSNMQIAQISLIRKGK
jgi:hypothetical protein